MKKGIKTLAAAALAVSALTPVAAAAATPTATNVEAGVYTTTNFYSLTDFAKLSTADKVAVLTAEGTVVVVAGQVYTANDVLNASDSELEALGTSVDEYTTEDGNKIESGKPLDQTGEVIDPVVELTVESVSAINKNEVTVTFEAAADDIFGFTVEVKDNTGKVVEVLPVDVSAGDEEATLKFKTPVTTQEGVWNVDGVEVDFDLLKKLATTYNAADQVKLLAALEALKLTGLDENNVAEYKKALDKLKDTVEEADFTLEAAQKLVDDANKAAEEGTTEASVVEAVVDAKTEVALLKALQNEAFARVNAELITKYDAEIKKATAIIKSSTIEDVQTKIDTVNDAEITALDGAVLDGTANQVDKDELTKLQALVTGYATPNAKGEQTSATKALLAEITEQLAVVTVLESTTANTFGKNVTALQTLLGTTSDLEYKAANVKAYFEAFTTTEKAKVFGKAELKTFIQGVNTAEATKGYKTVYDLTVEADIATDEELQADLIDALKALGLKQVAASNIDQYVGATGLAAIKAGAGSVDGSGVFTAASSTTALQTAVDNANVAAVKAADETTIVEALNVFELKNVLAENAKAYATSTSPALSSFTKAGAQTYVTDVNRDVVEANALAVINKATTAAEVKVELDKLAFATTYLNVTTEDRTFIAEQVLESRPAKGYVATLTAGGSTGVDTVEEAVAAATTERTAAIGLVNDLTSDPTSTTLTKVAEALIRVGHDSITGSYDADSTTYSITAEDTVVAQAFYEQLTFLEASPNTVSPKFASITAIRSVLDGLK